MYPEVTPNAVTAILVTCNILYTHISEKFKTFYPTAKAGRTNTVCCLLKCNSCRQQWHAGGSKLWSNKIPQFLTVGAS